MDRPPSGVHLALALMVAVAASVPSAGVVAQYGRGDQGASGRPAHIHVGLCPVPGEIVGPLSEVSPSVGVTVGARSALEVEHSRSTVDLTLSELVATEHVVAVHVAHDQMETIIACGDIGGPMRSATELVIGLGPVGDAGYSGVALLAGLGEGMTTVDVYITSSGGGAVASPGPYSPY